MKNALVGLALGLTTATSAFCAELVTITAKEPSLAVEKTSRYTGQCDAGTYVVDFSHDRQRFDVTLSDQPVMSLAGSQLGKAVLELPLAGDFAFHCIDDKLEIRFFGFRLNGDATPKPVSYFLSVTYGGKIAYDYGENEEKIGVIANYFRFRISAPRKRSK